LQDNWLLLTADYSQIELRLMEHFSKDSTLIELPAKPHGDVFIMIAARWTGKPEDSVNSVERDQTKRLAMEFFMEWVLTILLNNWFVSLMKLQGQK
jgi:DNA polymerase I-like protein with 3'-5' exonuclease and polymerase domains